MLHNAHDVDLFAVENSINFRFFGPIEEVVYEDTVIGQVLEKAEYMALEFLIVYDDAHPLPAKHIRRPHQYGIPDLIGDADGFVHIVGYPIIGVGDVQAFEQIRERAAVLCQVHVFEGGPDDRHPFFMQGFCQFECCLAA